MSFGFCRLARSGPLAAAVAAMGGWALIASAHPMTEPLLAGLLQGVALSAVTTLSLTKAVEQIAARVRGPAALWLPPLAAGLISTAMLTGSHALAGTPELLATVALPLTVATIYSAILSSALWLDRKTIGHARS